MVGTSAIAKEKTSNTATFRDLSRSRLNVGSHVRAQSSYEGDFSGTTCAGQCRRACGERESRNQTGMVMVVNDGRVRIYDMAFGEAQIKRTIAGGEPE